MYQSGGAISNLRHLLLAAQRWKPACRPYMSIAWEMVDRWFSLCPVRHRRPIPEVLVKAMCSVAWHLHWYSWTGATLLAFYGAGRLGEVLRCRRDDLLLPKDLLEEPGSAVFLQLRTFKSLNRQPAKIQHMRLSDRTASILVSCIFGSMPMDADLFGSTAYQYRKRWDAILTVLGLGSGHGLTPGGLRGGSAVYHYRRGKPIQDLMWLLRLRSQSTLESYLQEVASLNVLAQVKPEVRKTIFCCASTFPHLVASSFSTRALWMTNAMPSSHSSMLTWTVPPEVDGLHHPFQVCLLDLLPVVLCSCSSLQLGAAWMLHGAKISLTWMGKVEKMKLERCFSTWNGAVSHALWCDPRNGADSLAHTASPVNCPGWIASSLSSLPTGSFAGGPLQLQLPPTWCCLDAAWSKDLSHMDGQGGKNEAWALL